MDLRSFIEKLSERGQLHRIGRQVDWKYELGEMTRSDLAPLLFENIKDYPGHRVFTNGLISIAAIGLALVAEAGKSRKELVRQVRKRVANPIARRRSGRSPKVAGSPLEHM
jgi:UbiD family decarboxylase